MERPGARVLFMIAAAVVVIAGLRAAGDVLVPFMIAVFFAVMCIPPVRRLEARGCPDWLAIALVITGATIALLVVSAVVGASVRSFQESLPTYSGRIDEALASFAMWLQGQGIDVDPADITGKIDTSVLLKIAPDAATQLLGALSNLLLVLLTMVFILLEAHSFPRKVRTAFGHGDDVLGTVGKATESVQEYLFIKAWISLATGALAAVLLLATGVDFVFLWALIAFLFNFVPNIGSVIAAVPPVLLALLQFGVVRAGIVATGYIIINLVMGNMVEPRVMGRRLGLSPLVVFLSLVFWGWIWGPAGMLLSVPLTVIVKIAFEHVDDLKWLAIMLGPGSGDEAA